MKLLSSWQGLWSLSFSETSINIQKTTTKIKLNKTKTKTEPIVWRYYNKKVGNKHCRVFNVSRIFTRGWVVKKNVDRHLNFEKKRWWNPSRTWTRLDSTRLLLEWSEPFRSVKPAWRWEEAGESERGSEVGRGGRARDLQPHYDVSRNCAAKKRKTLFYDIGCHFVEGGEGRRGETLLLSTRLWWSL